MNGSTPPRQPAGTPKPGGTTLPPRKYWPWFLLVVLVNYMLVSYLFPQPNAPVTVPYTVFREEVGKGNVTAIYSRYGCVPVLERWVDDLTSDDASVAAFGQDPLNLYGPHECNLTATS